MPFGMRCTVMAFTAFPKDGSPKHLSGKKNAMVNVLLALFFGDFYG